MWPSLIRTRDSKFGSQSLGTFIDSPLTTDRECNVIDAFAMTPTTTIADEVDAILYLGPPDLALSEPLAASIALDRPYRNEWLRRMRTVGMPGPSTLEGVDEQVVADAANPVLTHSPRQPVPAALKESLRQSCLNLKGTTSAGSH